MEFNANYHLVGIAEKVFLLTGENACSVTEKTIIMRKAFSIFAVVCLAWVSGAPAATNSLLYNDNFESYTNGTPLIGGTNYWYSSTDFVGVVATVLSNTSLAAPGSTNSAMVPIDVSLSNRYPASSSTNVILHTQTRFVRYDATNNPAYDTNSTAVFYVDSNGFFVVCNGTSAWVTITNTLSGGPVTPVDTNAYTTTDIYLDYSSKTWRLNVNAVQYTNNISFVNAGAQAFNGFDVYNGNLVSSYVDNVSVYDFAMLPVLSVTPSAFTNSANAASYTFPDQSFSVISRGDGVLNYYIVTNTAQTWVTILTNATGALTNNATNTVWIRYTSLNAGYYSNSFDVISTNWEGQTQTVQIIANIVDMRLNPTNLANAALYGFNATNQTFELSVGGASVSFTATPDDGGLGWLTVDPASGYSSGGMTNILTNIYLTTNLPAGDYTGRVTVATSDGGGITGVVNVAMRIYATPVVGVNPSVLRQMVDKGGNPTGMYFDVWNSSASPIAGMEYWAAVTNDPSSIIQGLLPSHGTSTGGQHSAVGISFQNNLSSFEAGTYTASVSVVGTNYGSGYAGYWMGTNSVTVILQVAGPDAPGQINATKGDYDDRVAVSWQSVLSPAGDAVTYNVLRHTTFDPNFAHTIVSGLTTTNYTDQSASPGVRYYYWLKSVNKYAQSGTNSMPDYGFRRLATPGGLFASDGDYTNKVVVSWADVDGASSYYVYRSAAGLPGVVYHTVGTEFTDIMVSEGVEYTYYLQATNAICGSFLSAGELGWVLSRPLVFSASDGLYAGKIRLTWNAVNGATSYELWRSTQTLLPPYGGGMKIAEKSVTTYDDTSVTPGAKYYYWLKSKNATTLSAFSGREEGFAAISSVDLSLWGMVVQPRRIGLGGHPDVISYRLANNGGAALTGDNGTVRLTFYSSQNAVFGDADDRAIGTVDQRLELGIGSRGIFLVGGGNMTLPAAAGSYYLFMRLAPTWPSIVAPASDGGWVTQRAQALEVSSDGSISYQAMNDYDGDGISDMVVHGSGLWDARTADGSEIARGAQFAGAGVAVMGDYDGDLKTDPLVYDANRSYWEALLTAGGYTYVNGSFGGPGSRAVPGDYNGDRKTEAAVYDSVNSVWYAITTDARQVMWGLQYGAAGYEPVIGDYDGDGVWDLALYGESSGTWYVRTISGDLLVWGAGWGGPGYRPVPGDYDGDGLWDYALYDTATGRWYIANIYAELIANGILWGADGFRPVSGDFDGDGIYDLAMYNETAGKWYIRTVSGAWLALDASWGGAGYKAVGGVE